MKIKNNIDKYKFIYAIFFIFIATLIAVTSIEINIGETYEFTEHYDNNIIKDIKEVEAMVEYKLYNIPLDLELQILIQKECEDYNISPELIMSMIKTESTFNPNAVSPSGYSYGLMQVSKDTYDWIKSEIELTNDILNPENNIKAGIWYINYLQNYWKNLSYPQNEISHLALISYNQGIKGCHNYIKKYGTKNRYANEILEFKKELKGGGYKVIQTTNDRE